MQLYSVESFAKVPAGDAKVVVHFPPIYIIILLLYRYTGFRVRRRLVFTPVRLTGAPLHGVI